MDAAGSIQVAVQVRLELGDAVADAVAGAGLAVKRLAVREIPRSGKPEELLDWQRASQGWIYDMSKGSPE